MTTRAEEVAGEVYPDLFIRDDKMKTSGTALISDAAQMLRREGFVAGYKQGQQDRWIPTAEDVKRWLQLLVGIGEEAMLEAMLEDIRKSPPNPEHP